MSHRENRKAVRVLHVLNEKEKISPLLINLVEGLAKENFQQTICCLRGKPAGASPFEEKYPVLSLSGKKTPSLHPVPIARLSRIIRENRIDIVHCQRHKPTVCSTLAAWRAGRGVKVVSTVHGKNRTRGARRKFLNFLLFKRISKIISVSRAVRQDILQTNPGLASDKVVTIYNGIDPQKFSVENADSESVLETLALRDGTTVFGTVARLSPVKGQRFLLEAFETLMRRNPNVALVFAGTGPKEQELKERAKAMIDSGHVRFLGHRSDIPDFLTAIDCFVLPSLSEGHPLSLLEAMACERIVVASRVGGVPEILSSPDTGFTVEPGSAASLAEAMEMACLIGDERRKAMRTNARKTVLENYTVEKMVAATAGLYRSLIS